MRRVLFLAHDFPPVASAAAQRARQFVRYLPAHGWQPVVVTPRNGSSWAHDPTVAADLPSDLGVHRTGSIEAGRVLGRLRRTGADGNGAASASRAAAWLREWAFVPDANAGWIPFAVAAAARRARRADVVMTTNPPASAHVAGAVVSRVGGLPWVADFQDPWSLPSFEGWRGRWRPRLDTRLERAALRRADRVVATTGWLADELARRGAGERVRLVANGYEADEYPVVTPPTDGAFTLVHAGSFYGPRSPEPLLVAVAAAVGAEPGLRPVLRVRLLGSQDVRSRACLDATIERLGLHNVVERVGQRPRHEALAAMRAASVLVAVTDPVEGGRGLIPLKLYEYLGAGRPVLALAPPEGEAGRLVRAARAGIVVDPSDVAGAAVALGQLYDRWRHGRDGHWPDPDVLDAHRWERLAGELATVLDEAATQGGR